MNKIIEIRRHILLLEKAEKMILSKLSYDKSALAPVMSKKTIDYHYDILTKNYFKKANKDGDPFQVAGAFLHDLFWQNLSSPSSDAPRGALKFFIDDHFISYIKFKKEFEETANTIQGNGWCVLTKSGKIVQIPNHKKRNDIILILDVWEHAYYLDYQTDKKAYVKNFWKIVDWDKVSQRLDQ